jgi:hypothetical protein
MPPFTLNQAAKETKKSKATILEAIRSGRMSAPKDEQGRYQIDPAELFRVYPLTGRLPVPETATDPHRPTSETAFLREKVELLERIIQGIEDERDDLRRRLDAEAQAREKAADDVRRLTLILTHQTPAELPLTTQPTETTTPTSKGGLFDKLFGRGKPDNDK